MAAFRVETRHQGSCGVVSVFGELDAYTAPAFRDALVHLMEDERQPVVIDLSGTEFVDSSALAVMAEAVKRAASDGIELRLVCTAPHLLKILEISSMSRIAKIFDTAELACAEPTLSTLST